VVKFIDFIHINMCKLYRVFQKGLNKSKNWLLENYLIFSHEFFCKLKKDNGRLWKYVFVMLAVFSMDMLESNLKVIDNIIECRLLYKAHLQVLHTNPDKSYIKLKDFLSWVQKTKNLRKPFWFNEDMPFWIFSINLISWSLLPLTQCPESMNLTLNISKI
jgi:hypothetical protein